MHIKKWLFYFVCFFAFFVNMNFVNADDQLVCIYEGKKNFLGVSKPAVMYYKDSNGFSYIYFNSDDISPTYDSNTWTWCDDCLTNSEFEFSKTSYYDTNSKSLTDCPNYLRQKTISATNYYTFFDTYKKSYLPLLSKPSVPDSFTVNVKNVETVEAKKTSNDTFALVEGKSCTEIDFNELWIDDPGDEWDQACLYASDFEGTSGKKYSGCLIYQLSYNESSFETFGVFSGDGTSRFSADISDTSLDMYRKINNACPPNLSYKAKKDYEVDQTAFAYADGFYFVISTNSSSQNILTKKRELVASDYSPLVINNNFEIEDCGDLLSDDMVELISTIITYTKILLPILLIVLGIIDFVTALFSGKEEDMKKNAKKFLIRVIICMVIFLIPSLLQVILKIASLIWTDIDSTLCGIL